MKKINWLIAVVAVVAAALLVMLYFALGFQHVDNYLDVYLGILWVAIIAVFRHPVLARIRAQASDQTVLHLAGDGLQP